MSQAVVRPPSAPPLGGAARGVIRWVCTSNPFYVLSAGLFLVGLRLSFGEQARDIDLWALMSGLAGYTLLLAVTGYVLVRFGNVWDDVRTVLLLVVLMFLATSVTFDEVLATNVVLGFAFYLGGLLFAVAVSEGLLRGTQLLLPAWFRGPYYLILALFFLYPLALRLVPYERRSEPLQWGLFCFSLVAGLVFLTLLPAIRRGPEYVRDNGSPWRWPLYPWVLFGLLALAVPARAFLLCWSMDQPGILGRNQLIFGPYFVVPFGLALAVLLLEIGLVARRRGVLWIAMAVPLGLIALTLLGHRRADPLYREFLDLFTARLGADPLYLTLIAVAGFYGYASLRQVHRAAEGLTAALIALALVRPDTLVRNETPAPWLVPLLALVVVQLWLGFWRRSSWRCLLAAEGLAVIATLALPREFASRPYQQIIGFHLGLLALMAVGAVFNDDAARLLRTLGAGLVLIACLAVLFEGLHFGDNLPPLPFLAYPLLMAVFLASYALLLGHWPSLAVTGLVLMCWLGVFGWWGYRALRQVVVGLDHIALSLALFAVALLISLGKAGLLSRWFGRGAASMAAPSPPE